MPSCAVPGCGKGQSNMLVTLHGFPKDQEGTLTIWKARIANPKIHGKGKNFFICEDHFIKECRSPGTNRLRKYSLPTINCPGFLRDLKMCPGFQGEPSVENSFLLPPRFLHPPEVVVFRRKSNSLLRRLQKQQQNFVQERFPQHYRRPLQSHRQYRRSFQRRQHQPPNLVSVQQNNQQSTSSRLQEQTSECRIKRQNCQSNSKSQSQEQSNLRNARPLKENSQQSSPLTAKLQLEPQPSCSKSNIDTYPMFVDLAESEREVDEDVLKNGISCAGTSNGNNSKQTNRNKNITSINVPQKQEFKDQDFQIFANNEDTPTEFENTTSDKSEKIDKDKSQKCSKKRKFLKIKAKLLKNIPLSIKIINLVKHKFVPRHLLISKPVGFSNRQRLAWRIFHYLKLGLSRIEKKKSHVIENSETEIPTVPCELDNKTSEEIETITSKNTELSEIKATENNKLPIDDKLSADTVKTSETKVESELKRSFPPRLHHLEKSNTSPMLLKGHFRITDEFVKSKTYNLLTSKIGINPLAIKLLTLQMKTKFFCPLRQKFSAEDKIFALSLYKIFGLKRYKEFGEYCALPPLKSLTDLANKIPFSPGIQRQVFQNLKSSVMKLDETDKYCSVLFHEIPLAVANTEADLKDDVTEADKLEGLEEELEDDIKVKAREKHPKGDNVLVVMLRGINRDWRQPVLFEVVQGKIKSEHLANLLTNVLNEAIEAGFRVKAVIFNKKERYAEALSLLNSETFLPQVEDGRPTDINTKSIDISTTSTERYSEAPEKRLWNHSITLSGNQHSNPVWSTGYILNVGNQEISLLYNPSNLLRIIRNKWLIYDISFAENGKIKQASWNHIMKLYAADNGDLETRVCPKLTDRHVNPMEIDKSSIRCCTQVFSQRVSSIMRQMALSGACGLDHSALDTADLLLFFDKLYDSVSGETLIQERGKVLRCALTAGSPHRDFWRSAQSKLANMCFLTPFKEESNVFHSWLATLGSLHRLADRLVGQKGFTNLSLGHLNSDPLDNFIKYALKLGTYNVRPSYELFLETFKNFVICGDNLNTDMFNYQIQQLDSLKDYVYDEQPSVLFKF